MKKSTSSIYDLATTPFQKELLNACFDNLKDQNNRLRFNNFAYSIRELSRHFLNTLAPKEDVVLCSWFTDESGKGKITRGQKIKYAIAGGLSDNDIDDLIGLDILDEAKKDVLDSIELLNKFTHINEDTYDISDSEIARNSTLVIKAFENFANRIIECRESVIEKLESQISQEVVEKAMWEISDEIDILATHHNIEEIIIDNYKVSCISSDKILIEVLGDLEVRLQWGSDGDLRRGDGHELYDNFPFNSTLSITIANGLEKAEFKVEEYKVDTDKWYEYDKNF